jgi:hypothetical protein
MRAAKIAALVAVAILALTYSVRAGIGMWDHAHPCKSSPGVSTPTGYLPRYTPQSC